MFGWVIAINLEEWLSQKIGANYPYGEYPFIGTLELLRVSFFFAALLAIPVALVAQRRWGILSGAIGLVVLVFLIEWRGFFRHERTRSPEEIAVANLRTINTAEVTYLSSAGGVYCSVPELITAGLLDSRFASPIGGYRFDVVASGSDYTATAIPTSMNVGPYGFFSNPDAVIRYATQTSAMCKPCFPPGQSGAPVPY